MVVRGAQSYEYIRRHNGILYSTFREACQARDLLGDDADWFALFDEAIVSATSFQLKNMFMTVLLFSDVGNPRLLFEKYW